MEISVINRNIHGEQNNILPFGHDIAVHVFHEFISIVTDKDTPDVIGRNIERTILALARRDAAIATSLTGLRGGGSDSAGGHQQKLLQGKFTTFLPFSYIQLISVVRHFVNW